jgi:hypothetical protein
MSQDRKSGAEASKWGHETAKKIAEAIGASIPAGGSNECLLGDDRIVIKCAAVSTDQVGVTYNMLPRLKYVLGAFQQSDGSFALYALDPDVYDANERETRSLGPSAGRVGKVRRKVFEEKGEFRGTICID